MFYLRQRIDQFFKTCILLVDALLRRQKTDSDFIMNSEFAFKTDFLFLKNIWRRQKNKTILPEFS